MQLRMLASAFASFVLTVAARPLAGASGAPCVAPVSAAAAEPSIEEEAVSCSTMLQVSDATNGEKPYGGSEPASRDNGTLFLQRKLESRRRKASDESDEWEDDVPSLLIVQRSRFAFLESRLKGNLDTWVPLLGPKDKLLTIVSARGEKSNHSAFPPELGLTPVDCADEHNLVCAAAEYHRIALPMMHDFDALYVADDDVYIHPQSFRMAVRKVIDSEGEDGVSFGVWGCGVPFPPPADVTGWCGGAGFGLTRKAATKLMETPLEGPALDGGGADGPTLGTLRQHTGEPSPADGFVNAFLKEAHRTAAFPRVTNTPEDVIVGSAWKQAGLPTERLLGTYGWTLSETDLVSALHTCSPPPIYFHYLDENKKLRIHHEMAKRDACPLSLVEEGLTLDSAYVKSLEKFVASNGRPE